ncbi:hypothetical protein SAMN05443639_12011 [Stigmatella erecta]|uniref:NlpC/P60 family protein n=2 Tax=Stigmatella erecta TaxID=83460 RepID=A0A1I0L5V7_9BACT|nr:hypothetical protein SAMN05443639_12011 [Stigmatella erecta]
MKASHWKRYGQGVLAAALLVSARGGAEPPKGNAQVSCAISGPQCDSPEALKSDLSCRLNQSSSVNPSQGGTWGPSMYPYQVPEVAPGTQCPVREPGWQRQRILAAVDFIVRQQFNYCHHHVPTWLPPANPQQMKDTSPTTCTANRNTGGTQAPPGQPFPEDQVKQQGFDCSNFTTFLYSFALGVPLDQLPSQIDLQACEKGMAGVLLDINANTFAAHQKDLLPGDLLYIMGNAQGGQGKAPNTNITHVVVWTGMTYGQIASNPEPTLLLGADFERYNQGKPPPDDTPMIADSHYAGPAYRPFLGWYRQSLSHVRRIIGHNPDSNSESLPAGIPTLSVLSTSPGKSPTTASCAPVFTKVKGGATCKRPETFITGCGGK